MNRYIAKNRQGYFTRAQSALEYAALITVVTAVLLTIVWRSTGHSPIQTSLEQAFTTVGDKIVHEVNNVK